MKKKIIEIKRFVGGAPISISDEGFQDLRYVMNKARNKKVVKFKAEPKVSGTDTEFIQPWEIQGASSGI